jgi:nucleotide-binding universal stress UspA family protein
MERILLVLDGSPEARDEALRLASERGASLSALFVRDGTWAQFTGNDWLSGSNSYVGFLKYIEGLEADEAGRTLDDFLQQAADLGAKPRVRLVRGRLSEEVLKELQEGYDLLVMPHPLRRGLESMRDASARIIKDAPCSVYLVRAE